MQIEPRAEEAIKLLEAGGHEAWLVGGCVRDRLMGRTPKDWDIATSALPAEVQNVFGHFHVIETGLKHGTVTVVIDKLPLEITTYRIDGVYDDGRRPSNVEFVREIKADLARRDFTINAIAYNPDRGFFDPFAGTRDIDDRMVRCVGDPDKRLTEDALRLMRAVRFSSVLGFSIADDLSHSLHRNRHLLKNIAAERISSELSALLLGSGVLDMLLDYTDVFEIFIPEITPAIGFDQRSPWHCYDVWSHIAHSVAAIPSTPVGRLTMLFHDLGKPECFTLDKDNTGHFYGHAKLSEEIAERRLKALKFDNDTIDTVCKLVRYHDTPIEEIHLLRWLNKLGEQTLRILLDVKAADCAAQAPDIYSGRAEKLLRLRAALDDIMTAEKCFSMKDLAIGGEDIKDLGIQEGPQIGEILKQLLGDVLDGALPNDREKLMKAAKDKL